MSLTIPEMVTDAEEGTTVHRVGHTDATENTGINSPSGAIAYVARKYTANP
jgi:hypothetical protein